jgi:hypothetical protein
MREWKKGRVVAAAVLFMLGTAFQTAHGQAALLVLLFGEQVASEEFYFSLKLGANVAEVTGFEGGSTRLALNFGLLATIKLSDQFYVVPEFAPLSGKGISKFPTVSTGDPNLDALLGNDNKTSVEFNYLDIPVVVKYYPLTTLNVGVGPYVSYLLAAERRVQGSLASTGSPLTLIDDVKARFNKWDYGAVFEVGYAPWRTAKTDELNFHLRYALGLSNINGDAGGKTLSHSVFQIFVSLPFMEPPNQSK